MQGLARENARAALTECRIAFHEADLFPGGEGRFDWIVAICHISRRPNLPSQREVSTIRSLR